MHHFNGGGGNLGIVIDLVAYKFAAPQHEHRAKTLARGAERLAE
jgi:hypothetical protein